MLILNLSGYIFRNPGCLKSEHFPENSGRPLDNSHGQGCSRSLAETQAEIEDGFKSQVCQHLAVSGLFRAMAGKEVINHPGTQSLGH